VLALAASFIWLVGVFHDKGILLETWKSALGYEEAGQIVKGTRPRPSPRYGDDSNLNREKNPLPAKERKVPLLPQKPIGEPSGLSIVSS
jgi:hypothetical protein